MLERRKLSGSIISFVMLLLFLILSCSKKPTEPTRKSVELSDFYGSWIAYDTGGINFPAIVLDLNNDGTFLLEPMRIDTLTKTIKSDIIISPQNPISGRYSIDIGLQTIKLATSDTTNGYYKYSVDTALFAEDTLDFELKWINGSNYMSSVAPDSVLWRFEKNTTGL
jgi:hypothetical protein